MMTYESLEKLDDLSLLSLLQSAEYAQWAVSFRIRRYVIPNKQDHRYYVSLYKDNIIWHFDFNALNSEPWFMYSVIRAYIHRTNGPASISTTKQCYDFYSREAPPI